MRRELKIERASIDSSIRISLDATDPTFYQNPYPAYEAMRAAGPAVFWEQLGLWCLTGHDEVNAVLRDKRFGREILHVATREEVGIVEPPEHVRPFYEVDDLTMLAREPPVHTRLRTLVNRAFVSRRIEKLRPRVAALAHELIDRFPKGAVRTPRSKGVWASPDGSSFPHPDRSGLRPARADLSPPGRGDSAPDRIADEDALDLIGAFCTPIPVTIIAELLGVPADAAPLLLDWSHRMVAMYTPGRNRAVEDAAVAATGDFVAFLREHVAERRKAPRDDLISHLIAAETAGDKLSEDELIAGCIQLLNAGHEATVHSLGNAVKAILEFELRGGSALCLRYGGCHHRRGNAPLRSAAPFLRSLRARARRGRRCQVSQGREDRPPPRRRQPRPGPLAGRSSLRSRADRSFPTSHSVPGFISASARRSLGSKCRWRCPSSSSDCPA